MKPSLIGHIVFVIGVNLGLAYRLRWALLIGSLIYIATKFA